MGRERLRRPLRALFQTALTTPPIEAVQGVGLSRLPVCASWPGRGWPRTGLDASSVALEGAGGNRLTVGEGLHPGE